MKPSHFVLLSCLASCVHTTPEEMSASDHQAEAQKHQLAALRAEEKYDPNQTSVPVAGDLIWADPFSEPQHAGPRNPTDHYLQQAEVERAHAQAHLDAAKLLEQRKVEACGDAADVHACPLLSGKFSSIRQSARGVLLYVKPGVDADALAQQMKCYLAQAHYEGFGAEPACLLFYRTASAMVVDGGRAIELGSDDLRVAAKLKETAFKVFAPNPTATARGEK